MTRKNNDYHHRSAKSESRKRKRIILIADEGHNMTESKYLKSFDDVSFTLRFVSDRSTDPVNLMNSLVNKAKELELSEEYGDMAFCLVDADVNPNKDSQVRQADKIAAKTKIANLIVSNPCFEIWFLCHHGCSSHQYYSSEGVVSTLKKIYPDYSKNNERMYSRTIDKVQDAIKNSRLLEQKAISSGKALHTYQFQPSTEAYKVVEELLKHQTE